MLRIVETEERKRARLREHVRQSNKDLQAINEGRQRPMTPEEFDRWVNEGVDSRPETRRPE